MRALVLIAIAALAGCSSASDQAERQYQIVAKDTAGASERCTAARAVAAAHLKEQNETAYHQTKNRADIVCASQGLSDESSPPAEKIDVGLAENGS